MVKTKFNVGDMIYFMAYDTPKKGMIEGFAAFYGNFKNSSFEKNSKSMDEPVIIYSVGAYQTVEESKAFKNKEDLIVNMFAGLE